MRNSIDLFSEIMQKSENTRPEPIIVDVSPDAQGMEPELFGGLTNGLQEVVDINDGLIDESEYDVFTMISDKPLAFTANDNETVKNNHFVKHLKNHDELRANIVLDGDQNEIPEWMTQAVSESFNTVDNTDIK